MLLEHSLFLKKVLWFREQTQLHEENRLFLNLLTTAADLIYCLNYSTAVMFSLLLSNTPPPPLSLSVDINGAITEGRSECRMYYSPFLALR